MNFASTFIQWMFSAPEGTRSAGQIILWWERRRLPYNIIIGTVGFCSLLLFYFFVDHTKALKPGEDAVEPIALLASPIIINMLYTLGWIAEALHIGPAKWQGPKLLGLGYKISFVAVILPTAFWGGYWFLQAIKLIN